MKYKIAMTPKGENQSEVSISLDTKGAGKVEFFCCSNEMDFEDFIAFADAVQEIRNKFAIHNGKYK